MRAYEITNVILDNPHSITEETKSDIKNILQKFSVEIDSEEDWGQKKLWHKIRGNETGFYHFLKCKADPKIIAELENQFKLNQNILRSLIIQVK
jgi:small subunit ribosomal protein S6